MEIISLLAAENVEKTQVYNISCSNRLSLEGFYYLRFFFGRKTPSCLVRQEKQVAVTKLVYFFICLFNFGRIFSFSSDFEFFTFCHSDSKR